jgi:type IV secretion system protein VirB9
MEVREIMIAAVFSGALLCGAPVRAATLPRCLSTDHRVCTLTYDANQVFEVTGVYGYATTIEFAPGEKIENKAIGDSIAWEVKRFKNHVVLKPTEPNAKTNLTITTNRHVYYFRLSSAKDPAHVTFGVRFVYPDAGDDGWSYVPDSGPGTRGGSTESNASDLEPRIVNRNYVVSGSEARYGLQRVFDDGQFTYFLTDSSKPKPWVYIVGSDGTEQLVNTRRQGPYIVVEQMADRFTLRDGSDKPLCVRRSAVTTQASDMTMHREFGGGR